MTEIIISLTSIKRRYTDKSLHKTLNSFINLQGNYKIILNISKEPFLLDEGFMDEDIECLKELYPQIIINVVKNYGSLRKIIPTLRLFKNHIIITVDDDVIYNTDIVDMFTKAYTQHQCIISAKCRYIKYEDITISNFEPVLNNGEKSMDILPEGVGGILYHSSWFMESFINYDFSTLPDEILKNDDIFLRAYTYCKNIPVYKIDYVSLDTRPEIGLYSQYNIDYKIKFKPFFDVVISLFH
jgi:hypothetical protein